MKKMATSAVFSRCFLGTLEERISPPVERASEMVSPKDKFAVGDTVIVGDESTPRNVWAIGGLRRSFPTNLVLFAEPRSRPKPQPWRDRSASCIS